MIARLLVQSWLRNPRRKLPAVATVFFAAALISVLLAVSLEGGDRIARELKSYGANIQIESALQPMLAGMRDTAADSLDETSLLDESLLPRIKDIFWSNNILGFAPLLAGEARVDGRPASLLGTYFEKHLPLAGDENFATGQQSISTFWNVRGKWPRDDAPEGLVGSRLAGARNWKPGTKLTLTGPGGSREIKIVGELASGGPEENQIVVPLAEAQRLLGAPGRMQAVRISALTVPENRLSQRARVDPDALSAEDYDRWYCTAFVSSISHQLEESLPGVVARPLWQVAAPEGRIVERIQILLIVATIAALAAAALGVASLMTATVLERSREIGLMKALSARPAQILRLFYAEAAFSGLIGGLLGCLAGMGLARWIGWTLFGAPLHFAWIVFPCVLLVSLLVALLGTWLPARRTIRLDPAHVLYDRG